MYDSLVSMQESVFVYLQKSKKPMVVGIISSIHWVNYKFVCSCQYDKYACHW